MKSHQISPLDISDEIVTRLYGDIARRRVKHFLQDADDDPNVTWFDGLDYSEGFGNRFDMITRMANAVRGNGGYWERYEIVAAPDALAEIREDVISMPGFYEPISEKSDLVLRLFGETINVFGTTGLPDGHVVMIDPSLDGNFTKPFRAPIAVAAHVHPATAFTFRSNGPGTLKIERHHD